MTATQLPTSKRGWLGLIRDLGIRPSKGRGQNFLHDTGVVNRIVKFAGISARDLVIEIGPGLGILTNRLAETAERVVAIEIDSLLADHLVGIFASCPNVEVIRADAMTLDFREITQGEPFRVAANLPYSAAAAIAQHVLEADADLLSATFMVQREVGLRMLAEPPHMSILSAATQLYAEGSLAFDVPPDVFEPQPTVDSVVVQLTPHPEPLLARELRPMFFQLVNAGFRHKRKNIVNSLTDETGLPKPMLSQTLGEAGIDPTRRAQTLSVNEWLGLLNVWRERFGSDGT